MPCAPNRNPRRGVEFLTRWILPALGFEETCQFGQLALLAGIQLVSWQISSPLFC